MKRLFLFITASLLFAACSKEIDELPPASDTGEGTFGAKVNGVLWAPKSFGAISTAPILKASFTGTNSIIISASNFSAQPTETEFEIYLYNFTGAGVYPLNQPTPRQFVNASYGYYVERKLFPLNEWITNATHTGTVTVTKWDATSKVLAGTFQFNAQNTSNASDILMVTDGRFDVVVE